MNGSLRSADRGIHLRIAFIAALASVLVAAIGVYAQGADAATGQSRIARSSANAPAIVSTDGRSAIR